MVNVNRVGGNFDLSSNRVSKSQKTGGAAASQGAGRSGAASQASNAQSNSDILSLSAVAGAATQELSFAGDVAQTPSVQALKDSVVSNREEVTLKQLAQQLVERMYA